MADYDRDMAIERDKINKDKNEIFELDKDKNAKTFDGGAHRAAIKHATDGSEDHLGPKMTEDYGPKITDEKSYRSSMAKHWHQSNLLSENPIVNHATEK